MTQMPPFAMSSTSRASHPIRLFLDTGVIIEGCLGAWGSCKAALVLATIKVNFTVVLGEAIEIELRDAVAHKAAGLAPAAARDFTTGVDGWLARVRIERHPRPSAGEVQAAMATILPALRHQNDLPAVVTAMLARPDWVLSTNTEHWNDAVAARTGLRIATPLAFLSQLLPAEQR